MKAIDVTVSAKALNAAVASFYDHAAKEGLAMSEWALLGQVYRKSGKQALVRIMFIRSFWAGQIADVTSRMKATEERAAKRKRKAKTDSAPL